MSFKVSSLQALCAHTCITKDHTQILLLVVDVIHSALFLLNLKLLYNPHGFYFCSSYFDTRDKLQRNLDVSIGKHQSVSLGKPLFMPLFKICRIWV